MVCVWRLVFTWSYPQAECGLVLCVRLHDSLLFPHMDVMCHVSKPESHVWESGLCMYWRLNFVDVAFVYVFVFVCYRRELSLGYSLVNS